MASRELEMKDTNLTNDSVLNLMLVIGRWGEFNSRDMMEGGNSSLLFE